MRNITLRLISISGFLLLNLASLIAQCPDTSPVVIGPDVVRAGQTVNYSTYAIPGHTYSWNCREAAVLQPGAAPTRWPWHGIQHPRRPPWLWVRPTLQCPGCTPVQASKTITVQPLLHAYFYYTFDRQEVVITISWTLRPESERFGSPEWSLGYLYLGFRGRYRESCGNCNPSNGPSR